MVEEKITANKIVVFAAKKGLYLGVNEVRESIHRLNRTQRFIVRQARDHSLNRGVIHYLDDTKSDSLASSLTKKIIKEVVKNIEKRGLHVN